MSHTSRNCCREYNWHIISKGCGLIITPLLSTTLYCDIQNFKPLWQVRYNELWMLKVFWSPEDSVM
jgi:hypothetical protein